MKPRFTGVSMMVRPDRTARKLLFSLSIVFVLAKTASAQTAGFNVNSNVDFLPLRSTYSTASNTTGCPAGSVGKFTFTALLTNRITGPGMPGITVRVVTLTNGNVLLDPQTNVVLGGEGAVMQVPKVGQYADGLLSPGETVQVPFVLCLKAFQPFQFFVDVFGIVTHLVSLNLEGNSGNCVSLGPAISGDGSVIAFGSCATDLVSGVDPNGSGIIFVPTIHAGSPQLSADGRFLASLCGGGGGSTFETECVVDRSTGNQSHVTANIIPFGTGAEFALSSDGHFLAFRNFSGKVIGEGTGEGIWDVFESNLQTATTTLVSVHGANPVNSTSETPTISSNGRLVAFASDAVDLVPNDENGQEDVFVRDVETGITTLASVNRFGTGSGHGRSHNPILSPDGRFLAFLSTADDLVSNVTNVGDSVFVRDLLTGTTTLASVDQSGVGETSREPALSADGRFVAFVSDVPLVANDTNGTSDVFVRDLQTGTTTLASVNRSGTNSGNNGAEFFDQFNQPGTSPLSADGRFVLFSSNSTDLTANSTNGLSNCFVRDFKMRTTTLLSVNRTGLNGGNEASACAVISANGRFAAFESGATDLLTNDTNGEQSVYVRPVVQE